MENIEIEQIKIYDHIKYVGQKEYPLKKDYMRGDYKFACPFCDFKDHSNGYFRLPNFEQAVREHFIKKHGCIDLGREVFLVKRIHFTCKKCDGHGVEDGGMKECSGCNGTGMDGIPKTREHVRCNSCKKADYDKMLCTVINEPFDESLKALGCPYKDEEEEYGQFELDWDIQGLACNKSHEK